MTLDMFIATLQKMSLRKQQREYMIEANLVEWLVHHLNSEKSKMGLYRLEYICALLMNLSLHNEARSRASKMAPLLISIITSLLTMSSSSVSFLLKLNTWIICQQRVHSFIIMIIIF